MDPGTSRGAIVGPCVGVTVGLAFVALGLLLRVLRAPDHAQRLALYRMPATPTARATPGAWVKLRGTIVPGDTVVRSPVTDRPAVVCLVSAVLGGRSTETVQVWKDSHEFWLDDGSGVRARVRPQGADVAIVADWLFGALHGGVMGARNLGRLSDAQTQWTYARLGGAQTINHLEERLLQPGHEVLVVGTLHGDGSGPLLDARPPQGLTIVAETELEFTARLAARRRFGLAFAAVGALLALGAIAWGALR